MLRQPTPSPTDPLVRLCPAGAAQIQCVSMWGGLSSTIALVRISFPFSPVLFPCLCCGLTPPSLSLFWYRQSILPPLPVPPTSQRNIPVQVAPTRGPAAVPPVLRQDLPDAGRLHACMGRAVAPPTFLLPSSHLTARFPDRVPLPLTNGIVLLTVPTLLTRVAAHQHGGVAVMTHYHSVTSGCSLQGQTIKTRSSHIVLTLPPPQSLKSPWVYMTRCTVVTQCDSA